MFNESPQDTYPTYSICFQGEVYRWYHHTNLFDSHGVSPTQYAKILKGDIGTKYQYLYDSQMFAKIPLRFENLSNHDSDMFSLSISDFLDGLKVAAKDIKNKYSIYYGVEKVGKPKRDIPFEIGHQTPDSICFTRISKYQRNIKKLYEELAFKSSLFQDRLYEDDLTKMTIILHYPGQLLRTLDNPRFETTLWKYNKFRTLELKISNVVIQRKRPDSNSPCDNKIINDDSYIRDEIVKRIGCVPVYWINFYQKHEGIDACRSSTALKAANSYMEHYDQIMFSYSPPCVETTAFTRTNQEVNNPTDQQSIIKIAYTESVYQQIENVQDFSFESFWSSVGGFVGIFLGYSLLQFPKLLDKIPSLFLSMRQYVKR